MDTRDLTSAALFASLYFVINFIQASTVGNPAISGPVQLRVADCLIPLTALLGWPVAVGVTIGGFLTNAYALLGPVDIILGALANLVAATVVFYFRRQEVLACIVGALPIGIIVGGGYLWWFFDPPSIFGLSMPAWLAMMMSITISTMISMAIIGYPLLRALKRSKLVEALKARGLRTPE